MAGNQKLSDEQVDTIRQKAAEGVGIKALARAFRVSPKQIRRIVNNEQRKRHGQENTLDLADFADEWQEDF